MATEWWKPGITLVSYIPKKNDAMILLSSFHHDPAVDGEEHKTEIISHYSDE